MKSLFDWIKIDDCLDEDPRTFDISVLSPSILESIEADTFWSLSKLLEGIQDNYIFAQPGIIRQVNKISELCKRVDEPLFKHLQENGVEFIQFLFRWINCLLMREFDVGTIIRMWDTYLVSSSFDDSLRVLIRF